MMELSQVDIELIVRFNNGELSGKELASFNERMKDQDFASLVAEHNLVLKTIRDGGRDELRKEFASIHSGLKTSGGFEKYKPGIPKKGGGSGGWFAGIGMIVLVAASYLFYTGKIKTEDLKNLIEDAGLDTVYHYIYHTDTIYKNDTIYLNQADTLSFDSLEQLKDTEHPNKSTRKIISIDTVYQRTKK